MKRLEFLRAEVNERPAGSQNIRNLLKAGGYRAHLDDPNVIARAWAFSALLRDIPKDLYPHDAIAGSVRGLIASDRAEADLKAADAIVNSYGERTFWTNSDHYAPAYKSFLARGIGGTIEDIEASLARHPEKEKQDFLTAAKIAMEAFSDYIAYYALEAEKAGLSEVVATCRAITRGAPASFREALQLMWFIHTVFYLEGRYAMAIGRMDQFLYPYYENDLESGVLTREEALELVECTLYKIREAWYFGGDNVVNIAIGGVTREGKDAINELSYVILEAVGNCNIPGPNLSARLHKDMPPEFLDACLKVIGTGLGYPALMNDEVNIPALARNGYAIEDARDYCMVGCIENFLPGKQPPWSDGRYNTPKYLELALNNGVCMLTGVRLGPETGKAEEITSMADLMKALEEQMRYGAADYMMRFRNENERYNPLHYQSPFLSCFAEGCIEKGLDINNGGTPYPSVHGAGCMGIATMADSLAAIEKLVFKEKRFTLAELRDMLRCDFEGYEKERQMMLAVPKYGNDCPETDKYAVWFVAFQHEIFSKYRTRDGGNVYIAIASNVQNISAGREIAATPDGRKARESVSDAASPMHGMDKRGPTAVINSLTRPDYTLVSCGTVLNQKYSPEMFKNPVQREKLASIIRAYFAGGGQEMQINSVSRDILIDAMDHPANYSGLVVRVSGFSAYYTLLGRDVQEDILKRTEQS